MNRTFDRVVKFDERSRAYPIRAMISRATPRSYTWGCNLHLDQGQEGACTGFAVSHEAAARPVAVPGITNATAQEVYRHALQLDDWPGEDYSGTSLIAAMKAGKEKGWFTEYRWAFGETDLALAISYKGPAVLGVSWYEGMSIPDKHGIIRIAGNVLGGHAILCNGYNAKTKMYRLHNSWGPNWGVNGVCFISASDVALLLSRQGEACIPVIRTK